MFIIRRRQNQYGRTLSFVAGVAVGSRLMYLFDPVSGKRRRMWLRDKAVHARSFCSRALDKALRDLGNRAGGFLAQAWASLRHQAVPDEVLGERVRAKLGRVASHPNSIEVIASHGRVTLTGPILEREAERVVRQLYSVRGVRYVENKLEVHKETGDVPGLQGGRGLRSPRPELMQEKWAPATRIIAGSTGAAMLGIGVKRGSVGMPLVLLGGGVLLRSLSNMPVLRAVGLAESPRGIEFEKTIHIQAPVERVYELWSKPENFPRIMSHVKEVRKSNNSYHWTVSGPAGISVGWDAIVTENIPNRTIAWKSVPGATIHNAGIVRFDATPDGGTRVHLRMSYNPLGGVVGHVLASIFDADPKHVLDDDLVRMKSLFEQGKTTAHEHTVTREELSA